MTRCSAEEQEILEQRDLDPTPHGPAGCALVVHDEHLDAATSVVGVAGGRTSGGTVQPPETG